MHIVNSMPFVVIRKKNICDDVKIRTSLCCMNVFIWNIQREKTHSQAPTKLNKPCLQPNPN